MKTFEEWSEKYMPPLTKAELFLSRKSWNAATEQAKPRWIPVTERIPGKKGLYPCLTKAYPKGYWVTRVFDGAEFEDDVTHFLEMPE
ncbi:MAG: hypothetical protein WC901_00795 [Candidatus Margulisiibacteriota bacterium]